VRRCRGHIGGIPVNRDRVPELLRRWEERRQRGQDLSAEQLCADCPELVDEVRRRLRVLRSGASIPTSRPVDGTREAARARPPARRGRGFRGPPQQADEIGRLGPYRVLKMLDKGAMGMVFKAEDLSLQRPVALKVMLPEMAANPDARQRFLREARTAA